MSHIVIFTLGSLILVSLAVLLLWLPLRGKLHFPWSLSILIVPVLALGLYWHWGAFGLLVKHWQAAHNHQLAVAYLKKQKDPQAVVDRFKTMLLAQPNQPKGWFLLGNIYAKQNKLQAAYDAYLKARQYAPDNIDYLIALCQADIAQHNVVNSVNYQALNAAVKANPTNMSLRYIYALDAYGRKDYTKARKQWEIVLAKLPPEGRDAKQVLALIAKARRMEP